MTEQNENKAVMKLMFALACAILLIPVANYVPGPEWLSLTIRIVSIIAIATVLFFMLRGVRRRTAGKN